MNKCEFHFKTRTRINLVFFHFSYYFKCSKQSIYAALSKRTQSLISYHVTFYPNTTKMTVFFCYIYESNSKVILILCAY